jgi:hypothetical protein
VIFYIYLYKREILNNMIEFILIYLLVGVVFSTAMNWNEIVTIFNNWGAKEIHKGEAQEFFVLVITPV